MRTLKFVACKGKLYRVKKIKRSKEVYIEISLFDNNKKRFIPTTEWRLKKK